MAKSYKKANREDITQFVKNTAEEFLEQFGGGIFIVAEGVGGVGTKTFCANLSKERLREFGIVVGEQTNQILEYIYNATKGND